MDFPRINILINDHCDIFEEEGFSEVPAARERTN